MAEHGRQTPLVHCRAPFVNNCLILLNQKNRHKIPVGATWEHRLTTFWLWGHSPHRPNGVDAYASKCVLRVPASRIRSCHLRMRRIFASGTPVLQSSRDMQGCRVVQKRRLRAHQMELKELPCNGPRSLRNLFLILSSLPEKESLRGLYW